MDGLFDEDAVVEAEGIAFGDNVDAAAREDPVVDPALLGGRYVSASTGNGRGGDVERREIWLARCPVVEGAEEETEGDVDARPFDETERISAK